MNDEEERYGLVVEWFDSSSQIVRSFLLNFYPSDNSLELYDLNNRRVFLKRLVYEELSEKYLYVHNTVTVLSRKLNIISYADNFTKLALEPKSESSILLISHHAIGTTGKILDLANAKNISTAALRTVRLTGKYFEELRKYSITESPALASSLNEDVILVEFIGEHCVEKLRNIITSFVKYKESQKQNTTDVLYQSRAITYKEKSALLSSVQRCVLPFPENSTCCIVKPHAVKNGHIGRILLDIDNFKFCVRYIQMVNIDYSQAKKFYAVYNGVVPEYLGMVKQLSEGPAVMMCITTTVENVDAQECFRDIVGPTDPEVARLLRPHTLRANYGVDKIRNAVHCTDLPGDGLVELELLLKIAFSSS